jgi:hypothetical protein
VPQTCKACQSESRKEIDRALCAGESERSIAKRFGLSTSSVHRHKAHIESAIKRAVSRAKSQGTVDAARVLRRLQVLGIQDPRRLFNRQGALKDVNELDAETAATIQGLECVNLYEGEGDQKHCFGQLRKVRLVNPVAPLTKLGEHLGLFQPSPLVGAEVKIVVHYGDERRAPTLDMKPERPALPESSDRDAPVIVVRRLPAELAERAPAQTENEPERNPRPALPEPSPPARVKRVAPETGGIVRLPGPAIFDFRKPL